MYSLPVDIRDELLGSCLLLHVAETDIRAPISISISTSDVTPTRAGVTFASVSQNLAMGLYEHAEHKGKYIRLDFSDTAKELDSWDRLELPPILRDATACTKWRAHQSFEFTAIDRVNIQ